MIRDTNVCEEEKIMKLKNLKRYIYPALFSLASIVLMNSCIYEDLAESNFVESNPLEELEGYRLTMKVNLSSMSNGTRAGSFEDFEDYIDPQNLRILFFYGDNTKQNYNTLIRQFKITTGTNGNPDGVAFIPVTSSGYQFSKDWYVSIPISENMEDFANTLRANKFKIAVLANWPTDTPDMEPGDNIERLHHIQPLSGETYYDSKTGTFDESYDFLRGEYTNSGLGMQKSWISDSYSKDAAETFIKTIYGPLNSNSDFGDLWLLWNFDGAYTENSSSYSPTVSVENFQTEWKNRNKEELQAWMSASVGNPSYGQNSQQLPLANHSAKKSDGSFYNSGWFTYIKGNTGSSYVDKINGKWGIVLKEGSLKYSSPSDIHDVIQICLPQAGHHKITWAPVDENAYLRVEYRNHHDDNDPKTSPRAPQDVKSSPWDAGEYKITGDAEYMHLYAVGGRVVIYEIEHVAREYVYNTERYQNELSEQNLIPMYGIQIFEALNAANGSYKWEPGTTFDLSNFNQLTSGYTPQSVYLLRSVAKVELKIPKSYNAHHIYLRSSNRNSRCEPMDVSTPTKDFWLDDVDGGHNPLCELFGLVGHEPFYTPDSSDKGSSNDKRLAQYNNFRKKLAWWYGGWSTDNSTLGNITMDKGSKSKDTYSKGGKYPQILNPLIGRSDFLKFNESNSDSYYDRFVLYVPEKFVDDPGNTGSNQQMETTTPKICHIEFRGSHDDFTNVDDEQCYRIYFTDKGYNEKYLPDFKKINNNKDFNNWENAYEQNVENLQTHWTIMRNHVYSFTVVETDTRLVVSQVEVLPWSMVEDNSYKW